MDKNELSIGQTVHLVRNHTNYGYGTSVKLNPAKARVKITKAEKRFEVGTVVNAPYSLVEKASWLDVCE